MDNSEMRAWQYREENGFLPDEHYTPTAEDDRFDPESAEIRALVEDGYAVTNERRAGERAAGEIARLRGLLTENGIDPDTN